MNKLRVLFLNFLLLAPLAWVSVAGAMDEKDIPPPPMPEYMKKHQVKMDTDDMVKPAKSTVTAKKPVSAEDTDRDVASTPAESFEGQSAESIKDEFLNAGDEESQSDDQPEVAAEASEPSIEEAADQEQQEMAQKVYEDPARPQPLEEVSEVEESSPEFEQANIVNKNTPPAPNPSQNDLKTQGEETPEEPVNPETLAEVEDTLEEAEQQAEVIADGGRKPSAKVAFKAGMYKFAKDCTMYAEPRSLSEQAGSIASGRKLWIDPHDENWHKAYKKSGTVYIPSDCLQ